MLVRPCSSGVARLQIALNVDREISRNPEHDDTEPRKCRRYPIDALTMVKVVRKREPSNGIAFRNDRERPVHRNRNMRSRLTAIERLAEPVCVLLRASFAFGLDDQASTRSCRDQVVAGLSRKGN